MSPAKQEKLAQAIGNIQLACRLIAENCHRPKKIAVYLEVIEMELREVRSAMTEEEGKVFEQEVRRSAVTCAGVYN